MAADRINVTVVFSPGARQIREWRLTIAPGATLLEAVHSIGPECPLTDVRLRAHPVGVWGRKATFDQPLREGDRIEIYRPLAVDPKLARRERFRKQGVRAAGLFARKKDRR